VTVAEAISDLPSKVSAENKPLNYPAKPKRPLSAYQKLMRLDCTAPMLSSDRKRAVIEEDKLHNHHTKGMEARRRGWARVRPKRVALYLRVSTIDQRVDNQQRELLQVFKRNAWHVVSTFTDNGISGSKGRRDRAGYDALLKSITRGEVDLVAAWSVDRLGRSLTDLLSFLGEIHSKDCDLYLHQQGLDTSTPAGRAMFQMMGVFAEFERAMIRERVIAGLARAKAEGKQLGRPTVGENVENQTRALRRTGLGIQKIAKIAG
jgi:DNA invertase Pin-like site-specific DNA recombinase